MRTAGSDQLLAFIRYLRGRDIPISPADTLDAVQAASLIGYQRRERLKHGLAASLAKSAREETIFNEGFDLFFQAEPRRHRNDPASDGEAADDQPQRESGPASHNDASGNPGNSPDPLEAAAADNATVADLLNNPLVQAMRGGDSNRLAVAVENAAATAEVSNIRMFTQRGQYMRKMLDALGETQLREAAIELESSEPAAFEAVQALREQLRSRVRDRVERAYLVHASGDTEDLLDEALSKMKLGNVDPHHMQRLRKLMGRMARKLAARHGRRRSRARRGQLHVTRTLRDAIPTDGIPFQPRFRKVQRKRPQILAICDVSGSVAAYAKFLLMFLYSLQDVLPRTRSFAFSSQLGEVTDLFINEPVERAIERVNQLYGGATDYGMALGTFSELAMSDINSATTVIILGDARNNDADPRVDLVAEIKARCRQLIWLNPESRRAWGSGDSEMLTVKRHCHIATECNSLKQLERIVDKLLADSR
ncbi:MAG: VWA domain-containing protein [Halieaceae bacterium]|jgi:uncharacterized protein with von Willebrand factor type A (vWA) domain|nr:VWA domain-containing protein [Halieaceae bacterium]